MAAQFFLVYISAQTHLGSFLVSQTADATQHWCTFNQFMDFLTFEKSKEKPKKTRTPFTIYVKSNTPIITLI